MATVPRELRSEKLLHLLSPPVDPPVEVPPSGSPPAEVLPKSASGMGVLVFLLQLRFSHGLLGGGLGVVGVEGRDRMVAAVVSDLGLVVPVVVPVVSDLGLG